MNDNKNTLVEFVKASLFFTKKQILADVNLKIIQGELVYFSGKNGSGKSSLLRCISAELPISAGTARVLEFDLTNIRDNTAQLRRRLGIVSPEYPLIGHLNLEENLMMVLKATGWKDKERCRSRILELLEKFGLKEKQHTKIAELGRPEKIKAMIARALLNSPALLLMDEPTAGLDEQAAAEIMTLIYELNQKNKITVILSCNDPKLPLTYPGRVFHFSDGTVKMG